jgi:hypothetical protein
MYSSFLVINVCNQGKTLWSSCSTVVSKVDTKGCATKARLVKRVYAMSRSQMSQLTLREQSRRLPGRGPLAIR